VSRAPAALALAMFLAVSVPARAEVAECGKSAKRWVAVRLFGPGLAPELAQSVLADLQAEVRHHGLEACPAGTEGLPAPIATLEIEAVEATVMRLALDITDPATGKRSARDLQLDSMPLDGHSLAVAVAADELLTSSWIKLASRPLPASPASPPVGPVATAAAAAAPSQPRAGPARHELALLGAGERFGSGSFVPGLELALRRWLSPRWGVELAAGARTLRAERAPHGQVQSRAFPISLRALLSVVPFAARARAGAAGALTATPLAYHGEPEAGAAGHAQTALALYLRGELWADIGLGPLRLRALAGAGLPLRSVTADDSGVAVGGARGLELHGQLGLALGL
jgi:hypothetical protein